ncbi:unnamed protein product, partial [marine sediment metagenome]
SHALGKWFKWFSIPVKNRTQFKKGQTSCFKGRHHSKETKESCRIKTKKLWENPEFAQHQSDVRKGQKAWNKGLTKETDERVKKQGEKHKGFQHSKKALEIMSELKKNHWKNPDIAKKMLKGLWHQRGIPPPKPTFTKESLEAMSICSKKLWKDPEYVRKQMRANQVRPNGVELFLDFILQNNFPDEWKYVGDGEVIIEGLCPDFINCNGKKKIIELFGDYWHNRKNIKWHQTERGRKEVFKNIGFDTLVIWEHELNNTSLLIQRI